MTPELITADKGFIKKPCCVENWGYLSAWPRLSCRLGLKEFTPAWGKQPILPGCLDALEASETTRRMAAIARVSTYIANLICRHQGLSVTSLCHHHYHHHHHHHHHLPNPLPFFSELHPFWGHSGPPILMVFWCKQSHGKIVFFSPPAARSSICCWGLGASDRLPVTACMEISLGGGARER